MTNNPESQQPPAELEAQDLALLGEIGAALRTEREHITVDRAAFKARLRKRMNAQPATSTSRRVGSGRSTKVIRPNSWVRSLRYYAAALVMIGLTLGLLVMSGVLSTPNPAVVAQDIRTARINAEPISLAMSGDSVAPGELFKPFDNQKMLLIIDSTDSEACLALIPQVVIDQQYSELEKKALVDRPHWNLTVEQGRVNLPIEAYTKALGAGRDQLLLLKVAGHFEIWTADALRRYRERNQKQLGAAEERPTVYELRG